RRLGLLLVGPACRGERRILGLGRRSLRRIDLLGRLRLLGALGFARLVGLLGALDVLLRLRAAVVRFAHAAFARAPLLGSLVGARARVGARRARGRVIFHHLRHVLARDAGYRRGGQAHR